MSFAVPRNVPRFDNAQRAREDEAWSRPSNSNGLGSVFGNFGDQKELPLYKDKPYYAQGRRRPLWRRKGTLIGVLIGLVLLWAFLILPWSSQRPSGRRQGPSLWSWFSSKTNDAALWQSRRDSVRKAFEQSWGSYRENAWGKDEYFPLTRNGGQLASNPLGWIILDSVDSLMIMNLTAQLSDARDWIMTELNFTQNSEVNAFEASTRLLGGLLSAHYLSTELCQTESAEGPGMGHAGDDLYIETATDLADKLFGAFDSKSGIPYSFVNLELRRGALSRVNDGASLTLEASGMQLELKYQTKLIGETLFLDAAEKAAGKVYGQKMEDGLPPTLVDPQTGHFVGEQIGVGDNAFAYYVHLVRQYLQTSEREPRYRELWRQSWRGISKHLLARSKGSGLFFLTQRPSGLRKDAVPKMHHSACVLPGAIALAATGGRTVAQARKGTSWTSKDNQDIQLARELLRTCWSMHKNTATGLAPEVTYFEMGHAPPLDVAAELRDLAADIKDGTTLPDGWRSDLRIEEPDRRASQHWATVESLFFMWRITEDPCYRQMGWEIFHSFANHSVADAGGAFTELQDVDHIPVSRRDFMDPAWFSRTLKYLYLLFSPPDLLPLDRVVFSAGAHPFPKFEPRQRS